MFRRSTVLVAWALAVALAVAALGWWWSAARGAAPSARLGATPVRVWDERETWAFEPAPDRFDPASWLDLRSLNEAVAGETGFVRVGADGDFVRGDGQPIRFWAVNSFVDEQPFVQRPLWPPGAPDLARHARFLAKRGVNMVRLHRQIAPNLERRPQAALDEIDEPVRDAIWRTVAALRREGIYTTLSPYWAVPMKFSAAWGIAGGAEQSALGLLFFDPALQAAYKAWLRKLLAEPNPYTGVSLARDASLAVLQIQNEDSLLFWTVDRIQGPQRQALERRYADFLARKYGSLDAARAAWQGDVHPDDAPQAGRVALRPLWELTQADRAPWFAALTGRSGRAARLADQTEFLARTMYEFNREIVRYLKDELGVGALVNAGNWRTADAARLGDAERWSYTPGAVDAVNHYTGGLHLGRENGWAILDGDRYTSDSILLAPEQLPLNVRQSAGRPMLVTESGWVLPNVHGAEGPFLVAAYASLSGIDGYYWFAVADEGFESPRSANGFVPSQRKWSFATPEQLGSFPAAALAYRRGDIRRGQPVLVEHRATSELWRRRAPRLIEEPGFDPNRDAGDTAPSAGGQGTLPGAAYLVGPVDVVFDGAVAATRAEPLGPWLEGDRVRANSGEIELDRMRGWCRIDTPRAQGVAAHFERQAEHRTADLRLVSGNAFGAALAVSLDGAPLRESRRVLLQYATQSRPRGWQERAATLQPEGGGTLPGLEIVSHGGPPWEVKRARLEVALRNPHVQQATVLDMNGLPLRAIALQRAAEGEARFAFPQDAMYVVLH